MVRVEIQRIDPPADVVTAMHNQMRAERTRRALVTEAAADKEAAITRAEGEKQASILEAEGVRQRQILEAQGEAEACHTMAEAEKFRQQAVAEGEADAIRSVYQAIHDGHPTNDLIAVKYLQSLETIAQGKATKILPAHRGQRRARSPRRHGRPAEGDGAGDERAQGVAEPVGGVRGEKGRVVP